MIAARAAARCCELLKGRGHDDPDPPIGGLIYDLSSAVPDAGSTITVARPTAPPRKRAASVLALI